MVPKSRGATLNKLAVTVLMGGPDAERDVSIQSGNAVARALEESNRFLVTSEVIDKTTVGELVRMKPDVFFPVLHGPYGEGGPLQVLLEQCGIPFVGSSSSASQNAMDKVCTKEIANQIGIQTPDWSLVSKGKPCDLDVPLVLKPVNDGSSIDIAICKTHAKVNTARDALHKKRDVLLAESYICGREITVGILNGNPLPIVEIVPPTDIETYDFEAKYERDDTQFILEPHLPPNRCVEQALQLYESMHIQDIARVDFIIDDFGEWLLELNTMPGFTDHSLVPMAAKHAGMHMPSICSSLVDIAVARVVKS